MDFTVTATDACKNSTVKHVIVTYSVDSAPPVLTVPTGGDLLCNPTSIPTDDSVAKGSQATSECSTIDTITATHTTSQTGCVITLVFTVTAKDKCGKSTSKDVTYKYTVDTTGPDLTVPPGNDDLGCNPDPATLPTDVTIKDLASATDTCSAATITVSHIDTPSEKNCKMTRDFTVIAEDGCGNKTTKHVVFGWTTDLVKPEITCTDPDPTCDPVVDLSGKATATDNCTAAGDIQISYTLADGKPLPAEYPVGTTTVVATATDKCGNKATCNITVTVLAAPTAALGDIAAVCAHQGVIGASVNVTSGDKPFKFTWGMQNAGGQAIPLADGSDNPLPGVTVTSDPDAGTSSLTID